MFSAPPQTIGSISAGALLGTTGSSDLVSSINASFSNSTFLSGLSESFHDIRNSFMQNVVRPIQIGRQAIASRVNRLLNPDMIRPLIKEEDFQSVPPSMYMPIVLYPPVRRLLEQGRISGFGFDPDHLPEEDVYGRLINNGTVYDVLGSADKDGNVWLTWEWCSLDPNLSFDELDAIEKTRETIARILSNTMFDPTDYPCERG